MIIIKKYKLEVKKLGKEIINSNNYKEIDVLFDDFFNNYYKIYNNCNENNLLKLFNKEEILMLRGKFWDIYSDYLFE